MLNLDNLSVWFGGGRDRVDAVRNASFCVNSGASFGIVGGKWFWKVHYIARCNGTNPKLVWRNFCRRQAR